MSMKEWMKARLEVALIRFAANILIGRNVDRSLVTSRADNNSMWYMGERLHGIANRIATSYQRDAFSLSAEQRREAAMAKFCQGISTELLENSKAAELLGLKDTSNEFTH